MLTISITVLILLGKLIVSTLRLWYLLYLVHTDLYFMHVLGLHSWSSSSLSGPEPHHVILWAVMPINLHMLNEFSFSNIFLASEITFLLLSVFCLQYGQYWYLIDSANDGKCVTYRLRLLIFIKFLNIASK